MANKKLYRHNSEDLNIHQVHELYGTRLCRLGWLREKLRAHTVAEVLKMKPTPHSQITKQGRKKSPWRKTNSTLFEKEADPVYKSPFEKMLYLRKIG